MYRNGDELEITVWLLKRRGKKMGITWYIKSYIYQISLLITFKRVNKYSFANNLHFVGFKDYDILEVYQFRKVTNCIMLCLLIHQSNHMCYYHPFVYPTLLNQAPIFQGDIHMLLPSSLIDFHHLMQLLCHIKCLLDWKIVKFVFRSFPDI